MVLGVAVFSQVHASLAFKVQRGGVHEYHAQVTEQSASKAEQFFLNVIFYPTRRMRPMIHGAEAYCAKPGHGTIEMVQIDVFDSGNVILPHPSFTKPVGAWAEKTLQYGGENHPLNVESKAPLSRQ